MIQMPLFLSRMSVRAGAVIAGLVVMSGIAVAQAQNPPAPASPPPAKSTAPVETDIGRVTTDSGQSEDAREAIAPPTSPVFFGIIWGCLGIKIGRIPASSTRPAA
jgi:hypothetical protein